MSQQPYYAAHSGAAPVVVQGTVVEQGQPHNNPHGGTLPVSVHDHGAGYYAHDFNGGAGGNNDNGEWTKGEVQPKRCNDVAFAVLFYAHLGLMGWTAGNYAPAMFDDVQDGYNGGGGRLLEGRSTEGSYFSRSVRNLASCLFSFVGSEAGRHLQDGGEDNDGAATLNDFMLVLGVASVIAFIVSTAALTFMIHFAQGLIKFALFFNLACTGLFAIGGFLAGSAYAGIMGLALFAFTCYYTWAVWDRIPFAACNLVTATTAVRKNFGLAFYAYSSLLFMFGWSIWWTVAFVSSMYVTSGCNAQGECEKQANGFLLFMLLISYYWTFQVIKNTVHVTVAGTVGTWWFTPHEASSCCSKGVRDSFIRSISYSFGSICLGSLIVAIVQAMKEMLRQLRESDEGGGFLLCCAECLLGCIERLIEYFNQWAFVFVGLYGYTFMEAGKNVMNLFRTRGWTTIITDNLVGGVLTMVSVCVGLVTGLVAMIISNSKGIVFGDAVGSSAAPFMIGFVIGLVLTSVLMSVVGSAVNAVIVCYAEAPNEFQANHPELSSNMRNAWKQAWPVDFKY